MGYLLKYIVQTLPLYCVVLAVIYIVGASVNKMLNIFSARHGSIVETVFYNCFVGLTSIFMLYAIVMAKGISVFSPLLVLLTVYYLFIGKKGTAQEVQLSPIKSSSDYIAIAAVVLLCYAWAFFLAMPNDVSGVIHTYYDYSYYANTSEGMARNGVEYSKQAMYQFEDFRGSFLYHYPDMWLNALLVNVAHVGSMPALMYVVYPVFMLIAFTGCVVLAKTVADGRISTSMLYLIVLAVLGGALLAKDSIIAKNLLPGMGSGIDQYLFHWLDKKMLVIYIVATIALLHIIKQNYEAFFAAMLAGMYLYATMVPSVAGGLACVLAILFFFNKQVSIRRAIILGTMYVVALVTIVLFDKYTSVYPRPALDVAGIPSIKSLVILVVEFCIKIAVGALPVIAALFVLWFANGKKLAAYMYYLLIFLVGACGATALFISLNHNVTDINQALYTSIPVYVSLFALLVFVKLLTSIKQKPMQLGLVLILTLSTGVKMFSNVKDSDDLVKYNYDASFEAAVLKTVAADTNAKIVVLSNDDTHNRWYYHFNTVGSFTGQAPHIGEPLYINPYFSGDSARNAFWAMPNNIDDPMMKWFDDRQKEGKPANIYSFLTTNKVTYLFAEQPDLLQKFGVESKVVPLYTDRNTGQVFCQVVK
ncbi:MAG: hypothetical protein JST49_06195 [Bacteroidetes bacterium]|nr:hypothetical protein [Bacteroidota bacterium]